MRKTISFCEQWFFQKTSECPETLPGDWEVVDLPHTWNAEDGQDGGNDYWRGTAMYVKAFPRPQWDGCVYLEMQGAAMTAQVYLNGKLLTSHEGGYSTFRVDLTEDLQEENLLCVSVDNGVNDRIYPQKADFTFYGGLYRSVNLICVPRQHFELVTDGTPGIKVTPVVEGDQALVTVETWQNGEGEVTFTVAGQSQIQPSVDGYAAAHFTIEQVHLWDGVADPYLYTAAASFAGDEISTTFGCRTFGWDAKKGFLLNGRVYPLRGVSRHQDRKGLGNALTLQEHEEDMEIIGEIGANSVRLAHYQHAQEFYDLCDEKGLIAWAEIPYITQHMPNARENTLTQMRELITQCYNHPSICCWGLSNEITASGAVTEDMLENHRLLNELCHSMDATRPTTMAHVFMLETDSPLIEIADIGSYNLYFGWYLGELKQNDSFFDEYHTKYPNRCIGFSEYGADANPQYQSVRPERGDYTESYQCVYHEHLLQCIEARPYLWSTYVWNLFDFAADGRDEGGKHGENQKGLVTFDRSLKKDAFYLYKAYWSPEPFVHICGRRYVHRTEEQTEIKVYSNQPSIRLYVDGEWIETRDGERIFRFTYPISGEHEIRAVASSQVSDRITICKADTEDPQYRMLQQEEVVNWFDRDSLNPECLSIRDTMGEIMSYPAGAAMLDQIMKKARASRGDVAQAAGHNENLQKMMAAMPFESILKQAGKAVSGDDIRNLNNALQQIPKKKPD